MKFAKTLFTCSVVVLLATSDVLAQERVDPNNIKDFSDLLTNAPKKIKDPKLGDISPNELVGFRFFQRARVKGLQLGISSKTDVISTFGKGCDDHCEIDQNWRVVFTYFVNISKETTIDGREVKLVPETKVMDKLYSIRFVPKKRVSLSKIKFSDAFRKFSTVAFGDDFEGNGSSISIDIYSDSYGLKYSIFGREEYTSFKNKDYPQKRRPHFNRLRNPQ